MKTELAQCFTMDTQMNTIINIIILTLITSCSVGGPEIERRTYCKRRGFGYVCTGKDKPGTGLNWLIKEQRRLSND